MTRTLANRSGFYLFTVFSSFPSLLNHPTSLPLLRHQTVLGIQEEVRAELIVVRITRVSHHCGEQIDNPQETCPVFPGNPGYNDPVVVFIIGELYFGLFGDLQVGEEMVGQVVSRIKVGEAVIRGHPVCNLNTISGAHE